MGEVERGQRARCVRVSYWCAHGHESQLSFADESGIEVPETWDCPRCGLPAGQDRENPPEALRIEPFKTHLAYVKERRSETDGAQLLEEALAAMRGREAGSASGG